MRLPVESAVSSSLAHFPKVSEPASIAAVHSVKTPFAATIVIQTLKEATCRLAVYLGTDVGSVWGWP